MFLVSMIELQYPLGFIDLASWPNTGLGLVIVEQGGFIWQIACFIRLARNACWLGSLYLLD